MNNTWSFPFCPEPPDFLLDWDTLLDHFDWLQSLAGCLQDPIYHGEGNVLTHTQMVVERLVEDVGWRRLDPTPRSIMFAAALLHDVAKPVITQNYDGKVSSPGHAMKGARMAQRLLYHDWPKEKPPVPFQARRQIVSLVRYHGLPLWLLERPDMERAVITSSLSIRNNLIAMLATADVLGRVCGDQQELLEKIDLYREFCQEHQCWSSPYPFVSDHSRFEYFRQPDRSPLYKAYDDTQCEAVLMSGLPGAGKDATIQTQLPNWPVISLDALRVKMGIGPEENQGPIARRAKEMAREYLREQQSFIWNATNTTRQMRQGLINLFSAYHARIRIVYVEVSWPELLKRNQRRSRPVPVKVIRKLADQLDVPDLSEAHRLDHLEST